MTERDADLHRAESPHTRQPERGAIVLASGGLDSTTLLAMAAEQTDTLYALSFLYGQRHVGELECARRQAARWGVAAHRVIELTQLASLVAPATALVEGSDLAVPVGALAGGTGIPVTYVPARNTVFLSYALAWAEVLDVRDIYIGVNAVDYSGYPDCRPEFIDAFERMANLATKVGVEAKGTQPALRIRTPLIGLSKSEIITRGIELGVDYADTSSCYAPQRESGGPDEGGERWSCGSCDSCRLRLQGFARAGLSDPARYVSS